VVQWNVNSIRQRLLDGTLRKFFQKTRADAIFFSEVKSSLTNLQQYGDFMQTLDDFGFSYHLWNAAATQTGYSGVAMVSKIPALSHSFGLGVEDLDVEGRTLTVQFPNMVIVHSYVPCTGLEKRAEAKRKLYNEAISNHLRSCKKLTDRVLWIGDLNVTRLPSDAYCGLNTLPGTFDFERSAFNATLNDLDLVDLYSKKYPGDKTTHLTFYESHKHFLRKHGLRLDYTLATTALANLLRKIEVLHPRAGSDHLALLADFEVDTVSHCPPCLEDGLHFHFAGYQTSKTSWSSRQTTHVRTL
jgi:exodeoxyribonuclease-3